MKVLLLGLYFLVGLFGLSFGLGILGALFLKSTMATCLYIMFMGFGLGYFLVHSTAYLWNKF